MQIADLGGLSLTWLTNKRPALQFFLCPFFRIGVGPPRFRHGFVVTII